MYIYIYIHIERERDLSATSAPTREGVRVLVLTSPTFREEGLLDTGGKECDLKARRKLGPLFSPHHRLPPATKSARNAPCFFGGAQVVGKFRGSLGRGPLNKMVFGRAHYGSLNPFGRGPLNKMAFSAGAL